MRITSERWWRFTQEHCPILVQGCSFWLFGENLEKSDISHASAGKIFSFRWLLSENMWQRCAKMHKLDPKVEFCHCATWDRRGTLKVEEIGGEFSPFLPSFGSLFICLMWLVIFCSLLSLSLTRTLGILELVSWTIPERNSEEIFPPLHGCLCLAPPEHCHLSSSLLAMSLCSEPNSLYLNFIYIQEQITYTACE